jgi:hypothetical protein
MELGEEEGIEGEREELEREEGGWREVEKGWREKRTSSERALWVSSR